MAARVISCDELGEDFGGRALQAYVRSLTPTAEFFIVVAWAFGPPILSSVWFNISGLTYQDAPLTVADLQSLVVMEAVLLGGVGWFLSARGWTVPHFGPQPSGGEVLAALALAAVCYIALALPWAMLAPEPWTVNHAGSIDWMTKLAVSIINPLYEELLLCAYVIPAVARRQGIGAAVITSLAIRLACHTYQGPIGLISIGLFGLLMTAYYVRTRRIWPVIIAHGGIDFVTL